MGCKTVGRVLEKNLNFVTLQPADEKEIVK